MKDSKDSVVVAITGATGITVAKEFVKLLNKKGIKTHVILSENSIISSKYEDPEFLQSIKENATKVYENSSIDSALSSGSYLSKNISAVVVLPCTMKTLAGIANGYAENLIQRCVDVALKEGIKVVLCIRESPLNLIHIKNMEMCCLAGCKIMPMMMSFYTKPESIEEMIHCFLARVCDQIGIEVKAKRWCDE